MVPCGCRGCRCRTACDRRGRAPARKAPPDLHAPFRSWGSRGRGERLAGPPDGQEEDRQDVQAAQRVPRRAQGDLRGEAAGGTAREGHRERGGGNASEELAGQKADHPAQSLRRPRPSPCGAETRAPRGAGASRRMMARAGESRRPEGLANTIEYYATGKRKHAVARVFLRPGQGTITVNDRDSEKYFPSAVLRTVVRSPMLITETADRFNVKVNVHGGGMAGQAGAVRHGISRALLSYNSELRLRLKEAGFLTRDSRIKERKKYGQKGARKRFQFSKR